MDWLKDPRQLYILRPHECDRYDERTFLSPDKDPGWLIRCKDCKHYREIYGNIKSCHRFSMPHETWPDGYCAWAERLEDE